MDWSQNIVGDTLTKDFDFGIGQVPGTAMPLVLGAADPNAPFFDYAATSDTEKQLAYFDLVNQVELHPESATLGTTPDLPVCARSAMATAHLSASAGDLAHRVSAHRSDPRLPAGRSCDRPSPLGHGRRN